MRTLAVVAAIALAIGCGKGGNKSDDEPAPAPTGPSSGAKKPGPAGEVVALTNASFDSGEPGLHGWETSVGANNDPGPGGTRDTTSAAAIVAGTGRGGSAALELSGDARTSQWLMVGQSMKVEPGQQLLVSFATRADGLVQEGKQFRNAHALVSFYDASDQRLQMDATMPVAGSTPWRDSTLATSPAPAKAVRAHIGFFLSMSGTMWVDDVSVRVRDLAPWSRDNAAEAWDHLVERVSATYPFNPVGSARRKWAEAASALRDRAVAAADRDAFAEVVVEALRPLDDPHVNVKVYGQLKETVGPQDVDPNWNFGAVKARAIETVLNDPPFGVARLQGDIGYVLIGSWGKGRDPIERVLEAMATLSDVEGWIIDVRVNQGGDDRWARLIASRFATEPVVFDKHRFRAGDGYGPWEERLLYPDAEPADTRKVVVLQGPLCMSSNEGFIATMRVLPNVTTVGLTSRGATRNPGPLFLSEDVIVMSSRWEAALPDGSLIEDAGIPPGVVVDRPPGAYAQADPTLDVALGLLK